MRLAIILALAAPICVHAQDVTVRDGGDRESARIVRESFAKPHVVREGTGKLEFPRDSSIASTLIVIGRPTFLASSVSGDVVVIGADLFLRPGANISGRAVAIGGTVVPSALAQVRDTSESIRDETYVPSREASGLVLTYMRIGTALNVPMFDLSGLQGLLPPSYDRVDGLSFPVGGVGTFANGDLIVEPRVTYRSRLGTIDPRVDISVAPDRAFGAEFRAGRDTRSNEKWIYGDLVNSVTSLFIGSDVRNYFRASGGEARAIFRGDQPGRAFMAYAGARQEDVSAITAAGNVFSFRGRKSIEKMSRPNPLVESGTIRSGLVGGELTDTSGVVFSTVAADFERSFETVAGTGAFTQVTLDGRVKFPTFGMQMLQFRGHAVATYGSRVTRARYAYLGGSGTLPVLELLEQGGDELLFVESRYLYPLDNVSLPLVGNPILTLRHLIGGAGVEQLRSLENEIGIGLGLSALRLDFTFDAGHRRGGKFGIGISLGR